MRAVVFHGAKDVRVEDRPDPKVELSRDAVVQVTSSAICGSDLHLYNGFVPQKRPMVLGHEVVGIVENVGPDVTSIKAGMRVAVMCTLGCGECWFCLRGLVPQCERTNPLHYGPGGNEPHGMAGGLLGFSDLYGGYDGGQADRVRVPYADFNLKALPDDVTDEQVLFLTDILATAWTAIDWTEPVPGESIVVIGCGPVGLLTQKCARVRGLDPVIGVDIEPVRLAMARSAAGSIVIDARDRDAVEQIRRRTEGRGTDIAIDAVGMESHRSAADKLRNIVRRQKGSLRSLQMAFDAVRRAGRVTVIGVYGGPMDQFPIDQAFDKSLVVRSGQTLVHKHFDTLLKLVREGRIRADDIITHVMPLERAADAYHIFNEKKDGCVKVVLKPGLAA